MTVVAAAVIGGALITGAVAYDSAKKAERANEDSLGFAQRQYDDWQQVFGPIQENLSEYYSNLSPDTFAAQGIQYAEEEFAKVDERLSQSLAQRGIQDSGISASLERESAYDLARTSATIRQAAPQAVAQQQLGFLSVGMGNNPDDNLQNTLNSNANRANADSNAANAAFGNSVNSAVNYGIGQYSQSTAPTGTSGSAVPNAGTTSSFDTGVYGA